MRRNRRRYGGWLVHIGVILLGLGVIGSRLYPFETQLTLYPGDPVSVKGYTLEYEGSQQETLRDGVTTWAAISAYRGRKHLTTLRPRLNQYQYFEQPVALPALFPGLREDLYVVPLWWAEDGSLIVDVHVSPLINLLWSGASVLMIGGLVALWPAVRAVRVSATWRRRRELRVFVLLVVAVLLCVAAALAVSGAGVDLPEVRR